MADDADSARLTEGVLPRARREFRSWSGGLIYTVVTVLGPPLVAAFFNVWIGVVIFVCLFALAFAASVVVALRRQRNEARIGREALTSPPADPWAELSFGPAKLPRTPQRFALGKGLETANWNLGIVRAPVINAPGAGSATQLQARLHFPRAALLNGPTEVNAEWFDPATGTEAAEVDLPGSGGAKLLTIAALTAGPPAAIFEWTASSRAVGLVSHQVANDLVRVDVEVLGPDLSEPLRGRLEIDFDRGSLRADWLSGAPTAHEAGTNMGAWGR